MSLALRAKGHKVVTAADGMEALELLVSSDVDLLVTDLNMPNMDGYELIRAVRENPSYSALPVIILSSEDGEEDIRRGMELGANSYLVKPFVPQKIQEEVSKFI